MTSGLLEDPRCRFMCLAKATYFMPPSYMFDFVPHTWHNQRGLLLRTPQWIRIKRLESNVICMKIRSRQGMIHLGIHIPVGWAIGTLKSPN